MDGATEMNWRTELQWTEAIGRNVALRPHTVDRQVWADTYTGRYHLPPKPFNPSTVLDLGCNIGLTIAHYQVIWPDAKIVGVEMDHGCAELARLNVPGVTILERAVSGSSGLGSYNPDARSDSFSLGGSGQEVQVYDLGTTIVDAFGEGVTVDFVKMDIEGAEWDVFSDGSWVDLVDALLVELHDSGTSPEIVARGIEALTGLGYHAVHHLLHPQAVWATKA